MLRDRYRATDLFTLVPALTLSFEPVLAQLDNVLDDDTLFHAVRVDLAGRRPHTCQTGRPSTPVDVTLRMLLVRRRYRWSYAETEHVVADSLVLRQCCRLGLERVPDDTTLLRWANLIQPATLQTLLDHVVVLADGVRVFGRLIRRAKPAVAAQLAGVRAGFRIRTRSARAQVQRIHRLARRKGEAVAAAQREAYAKRCGVTRQVIRQAARVHEALTALGEGVAATGQRVRRQFEELLPLVRRVIDQAERRVLRGEPVPASEKVVTMARATAV